MSFDPKPEWRFQTSRRGLLRFLSGATLIGGAAVAAKEIPEPTEGVVKLATPADLPRITTPFGHAIPDRYRNVEMQVVPWRLYDSFCLEKHIGTTLQFFSHSPLHHSRSVTNLQMPNCLPEPQHFSLHRLWLLLSGSREAAEQFACNASLRLQIGYKIQIELPVTDICRYGLEAVSVKGNRDEPGPRCMDFTSAPPLIQPGEFFKADLEFNYSVLWCSRKQIGGYFAPALVVQCILDGLMARGIQ